MTAVVSPSDSPVPPSGAVPVPSFWSMPWPNSWSETPAIVPVLAQPPPYLKKLRVEPFQ